MAACRVLEDVVDHRPSLRLAPPLRPSSFDKLRMTSVAPELNTSGDDPRYSWDLLNRMLTYKPDDSSDAITYTYRADGQRTKKVDDYASPSEETLFYYDGQMGVQDTHDDGTDVTVTKYGVGARGIDVITRKVNSGSETFAYPVYDTHGNMVATLARASSNSFTVGNEKSYDVWGAARSGSSSVDQGYVANLGHRNDAESSLTYMRARYYEPSTGRFVSEDPAMDGLNWYIYGVNNPISSVDFSGTTSVRDEVFNLIKKKIFQTAIKIAIGGVLLMGMALYGAFTGRVADAELCGIIGMACVIVGLAVAFANAFGAFDNHIRSFIDRVADGSIPIVSGLTGFDEVGIAIVGVALGVRSSEDDDAWVWGL